MNYFSVQEVMICSRFKGQLHEWADIQVLQVFMDLNTREKLKFLESYKNTEEILSYLYLKTVLFNLKEKNYKQITKEMNELGLNVNLERYKSVVFMSEWKKNNHV